MAIEGDLSKANGDIWYAGDVNALLKQSSIVYRNNAQMIYNSAYIGYDPYLNVVENDANPSLYNTTYNLLRATTGFNITLNNPSIIYDTSHNVFHLAQADIIYSGDVYDNYEGTTPDTGKWTMGGNQPASNTLTQVDNQYIQAQMSRSYQGNFEVDIKTDTLDLEPAGTNSEFIVKCSMTITHVNTNSVIQYNIYLEDGGANSVVLFTNTSGSAINHTTDKTIRVVIDSSANEAYIYDITSSWDTSPTTVDISTITLSTSFLRFENNNTTSGSNSNGIIMNVKVYPFVYINGSLRTSTSFETDAITTTSTIDSGFITVNGETDDITLALSSNNGTNYTTFTNNTIGTINNSGTQLKTKFTFGGTPSLIPKISEYAVFYDVW